jgi:hypothetical protein
MANTSISSCKKTESPWRVKVYTENCVIVVGEGGARLVAHCVRVFETVRYHKCAFRTSFAFNDDLRRIGLLFVLSKGGIELEAAVGYGCGGR